MLFRSAEVDELFAFAEKNPGAQISADLEKQTVTANGKNYKFDINPFSKECLLKGLDQIGWTLQFSPKIEDYEKRMKARTPWL